MEKACDNLALVETKAGKTISQLLNLLSSARRQITPNLGTCRTKGPLKNYFTFSCADPSRMAALLVG